VTPAPATAAATVTLAITSDPPGARVLVGKKVRGTTPLRLQVPPGKVSLVVERDGFKTWKKDLVLVAGSMKLAARLERLPQEAAAKPTPTPAGVKAGDLVPLGPDVTPPKRRSDDQPEVPRNAPKASGSVLVEFVVDEDGRTTDAKVTESAGAILDAACLDAVKRWRYTPASTQGVKVKVVQRARFTFQSK
jgi:TonB family protein